MNLWQWFQQQVLGMQWLNEVVGAGLGALGVDTAGRVGASVQFFLYDTIKITVLLCVLIFGISYIQSYFLPERSKRILGRFRGLWANVAAAPSFKNWAWSGMWSRSSWRRAAWTSRCRT